MNQDADNRTKYLRAVAKALDRALVKVAKGEYQRLSENLSRGEIANGVKNALLELKKLQYGKMPCYDDEWVPLFYSTWYQPSHINLAYSMIDAMIKQRGGNSTLTETGRLHVVDFGCGTLAMQFGVALAAADALQRGERIHSIRFDLIDHSQGMVDMGRKIWDQFKEEVGEDRQLALLGEACKLVKSETLEEGERPEVCEGEDRWVSAIHAVYEENEHEVKEDLASLECVAVPDAGFITSHKSSSCIADCVSPFKGKGNQYESRKVCVQHQLDLYLEGELYGVANWRNKVYDDIRQYVDDPKGLVGGYLVNDVSWYWPPANFLIYTRRYQP